MPRSKHRDRDNAAAGRDGDGAVVELDPREHAAALRVDPQQGLIAGLRYPDAGPGRGDVQRLRADLDALWSAAVEPPDRAGVVSDPDGAGASRDACRSDEQSPFHRS